MRDGLVAWNGDVATHTPGRTNDNRRHLSTIAVGDESPVAFDGCCISRLRHPGTGGMLQMLV